MQGCSGGNLDRVAGRGFRSCTPAFANFSPPVGGEGSSVFYELGACGCRFFRLSVIRILAHSNVMIRA